MTARRPDTDCGALEVGFGGDGICGARDATEAIHIEAVTKKALRLTCLHQIRLKTDAWRGVWSVGGLQPGACSQQGFHKLQTFIARLRRPSGSRAAQA